MSAPFDVNDDSVVVVIGTGAGGGVLSNELAQKGISVVALEAGGRHLPEDYINDEWPSFGQLAWTDMRTTSGSWQVAQDFPNLPAWIVKAVGGSTVHWAGASLRLQEHEFRIKSEYGEIEGANLLDWPLTLADLEPYYDKAEDKLGVTRTNGIEGLPGNNNFKVMKAGAVIWVTKNVTQDVWRLIQKFAMVELPVSNLDSVFRVARWALNGHPLMSIFLKVKLQVILKSGNMRMS